MPAAAARRASLLALVTSALNVIVLASVYAFIGVLSSSTEEVRIPALFNALPLLSLLATLLTIGMGGFAVLAWKDTYWSLIGRVYYTLLALVALLFLPAYAKDEQNPQDNLTQDGLATTMEVQEEEQLKA